mmetsp:Transcript_14666/g.46987  ORF Transcript_14666/g.46987 Transcript_14666/m.46987 type:complete len:224 (+) Transcript_14666:341-1012(+)
MRTAATFTGASAAKSIGTAPTALIRPISCGTSLSTQAMARAASASTSASPPEQRSAAAGAPSETTSSSKRRNSTRRVATVTCSCAYVLAKADVSAAARTSAHSCLAIQRRSSSAQPSHSRAGGPCLAPPPPPPPLPPLLPRSGHGRLDEHEAQTTFAHRRHCLRLREVRPLMPPKTSEVRGLRHEARPQTEAAATRRSSGWSSSTPANSLSRTPSLPLTLSEA